MYPEELKYTKEHEWIKIEDANRVRVGITHFAQKELGDVVFVELPEAGTPVTANESFAVVESVKAVSDIYAPLSGSVMEANQDLEDRPELVNEDPYGEGWIAIIEVSDPAEMEGLLTAEDYQKHIEEE